MNKKRIGIIGIGNIARGVHVEQLKKLGNASVTAICDIDENKLSEAGTELNIDASHRFTDYHELIGCADVDAVEICTPNYLHVEMAKAALEAGKPVNIEKPLSVDYGTAAELDEILKDTCLPAMMCFSYRFMPAVRFAKWILEQGMLGDIVNADIAYLKSSAFIKERKLEWRFIKEYAGSGVLGDLGVHLIDMTRFLLGEIDSVCGHTDIVVRKRQKIDSDETGDVTTDDFCAFLAKLSSGAFASFTVTRCAIGEANTIKYDIYGTKGVISFNLNKPEILNVCIGEIDTQCGGMHEVTVPKRFFKGQEETFVDALYGKYDEHFPYASEGIKCQKILDAIFKSSEENKWINI